MNHLFIQPSDMSFSYTPTAWSRSGDTANGTKKCQQPPFQVGHLRMRQRRAGWGRGTPAQAVAGETRRLQVSPKHGAILHSSSISAGGS